MKIILLHFKSSVRNSLNSLIKRKPVFGYKHVTVTLQNQKNYKFLLTRNIGITNQIDTEIHRGVINMFMNQKVHVLIDLEII